MTVNSYQDLADELGAQSERRYELWRAWAGQYALAATEREQGGESDDESRGLHSAFVPRFGWAWFVAAFAVGILIGLAGWR